LLPTYDQIRSEVGGLCSGEIRGLGAYNEVAQGIFQIAVDRFALLNKGTDQGNFGFSAVKARYHIKGEDMDYLVEEASHQIAKPVLNLLAESEFKKPFMFWLFPNYHMVVAINAQDLP